MIARLFHRGVSLSMASGEIRARTIEALRASLAPHVAVSPTRLAELAALSDRALEARAASLDGLAETLSTGLGAGDTAPARLLAGVQDRDTPLPRDWTDALASAREWHPARAEFQRTLLEALQEHLGGERACVRALLANRGHASGETSDRDGARRQRLLLDVAVLAGGDGAPRELDRISRGDPVEVRMGPGQALEMMFAQHRFLLVCGVPWLLVDDAGEDQRLQPGRNVVGRNNDCDVMVHESYRSVSRRHVVLEVHGTRAVVITDLSSLGTFLPSAVRDDRLL